MPPIHNVSKSETHIIVIRLHSVPWAHEGLLRLCFKELLLKDPEDAVTSLIQYCSLYPESTFD